MTAKTTYYRRAAARCEVNKVIVAKFIAEDRMYFSDTADEVGKLCDVQQRTLSTLADLARATRSTWRLQKTELERDFEKLERIMRRFDKASD